MLVILPLDNPADLFIFLKTAWGCEKQNMVPKNKAMNRCKNGFKIGGF